MTSSWFFLSTLNYDARSTTHQLLHYFQLVHLKTVHRKFQQSGRSLEAYRTSLQYGDTLRDSSTYNTTSHDKYRPTGVKRPDVRKCLRLICFTVLLVYLITRALSPLWWTQAQQGQFNHSHTVNSQNVPYASIFPDFLKGRFPIAATMSVVSTWKGDR